MQEQPLVIDLARDTPRDPARPALQRDGGGRLLDAFDDDAASRLLASALHWRDRALTAEAALAALEAGVAAIAFAPTGGDVQGGKARAARRGKRDGERA